MANNFVLDFGADSFKQPASNYAAQDQVPTTLRDCVAFSPSTDESIILEGRVPEEFTGTGTLKLDLGACANTTTAADDARIDVVTEFRTPDAGEGLNVDNFDGTPDSGTFTFSTTVYDGQTITITLTPAVTPVAGDFFRIKITRDANHGSLDSLASDLLMPNAAFYEAA